MSSDRIIVDAIKVAQDLLLQNLPPAHILDDPHLNKALGLPQNSRMTFRRSRF